MKSIQINKKQLLTTGRVFKIAYIIPLCILLLINSSCNKADCDYKDDQFPYACTNGMDVAFLIDYTGSMGGAIDNIKASVSSIVSTIITKSGGDYRLSLSIFDETGKANTPAYISQTPYTSLPAANKIVNTSGIPTNQYLTMMEKFGTANTASFSTQLAKLNTPTGTPPMSMGSGNGFAEPGGLLLDKIINANFAGAWRPFKTKLAIIITDAPDGGDDDINNATDDTFLTALAASANAQGVQCILVTTLSASNYSVKLIGNNTGGLQLLSANFANISTDISNMINELCTNNEK